MARMLEKTKKTLLESVTRGRLPRRVGEIARQEISVALPAAKRAISHGVQAFLKKFSEEYAKERKRQLKKR